MALLQSCLRGMLVASKGRRLLVSDYSAIEARVLAWLAGHNEVLKAFEQNLDIYKVTASAMYDVHYDRVNKEQRFLGKVATLALGYQGGVKAFQIMASNYGTSIDDATALKVRDGWRVTNAPIVDLWYEVEVAARNAIKDGKRCATKAGDFMLIKGDLLFKLPSGRCLSFPKAAIKAGKLTHEGMNNFTHKWGTIETYGGWFVQSITQAVARDLLANALLNLEHAGYDPILTVHDEIISDTRRSHGSLAEFNELMCKLPHWAKGLPVAVEGYEASRYRK